MAKNSVKTVIGMDIGKKYSWCEAISTETGEVLKEKRLMNCKENFSSFIESLPKPVRLRVNLIDTLSLI